MQYDITAIINGYAQGYFLMADEDDALGWYSSRDRTLIPLNESFHYPKSLRRVLNQERFTVAINRDFKAVVAGCANRELIFPALRPTITVASTIHPVAQVLVEQWHSRPEPPDRGADSEEPGFFSALGWITAGLGTLAVGLVLGRELRRRYKFNRRTPYDFYAHSGDESDLEFGVGV